MLAFPTSLLPSHSALPPTEVSLSLALEYPPSYSSVPWGGDALCGGAWGGQALAAGLLSPPQLSLSSS